jgi:hypothetical protein
LVGCRASRGGSCRFAWRRIGEQLTNGQLYTHGPQVIRPSEWIAGDMVANPTDPLARWMVGGVHPRPVVTSE